MKRLLAVAVLVLAIFAVGAIVTLSLLPEAEATFTEEDAEATMRMVLERCPGVERPGPVACVRADDGQGFECESRGGYEAAFDEPDPEEPELSVVC